jgi:hypothetical protein
MSSGRASGKGITSCLLREEKTEKGCGKKKKESRFANDMENYPRTEKTSS